MSTAATTETITPMEYPEARDYLDHMLTVFGRAPIAKRMPTVQERATLTGEARRLRFNEAVHSAIHEVRADALAYADLMLAPTADGTPTLSASEAAADAREALRFCAWADRIVSHPNKR